MTEAVAMDIRELSPDERARVEKYLMLDEEQLFSLIPVYLPEYNNSVFSPEGQLEAGRTWFEAIRSSLEQKVCHEWQMCRMIADPDLNDVTNLVVVIGDTVRASGHGFPPFVVASIIVRMGVRRFCSCP